MKNKSILIAAITIIAMAVLISGCGKGSQSFQNDNTQNIGSPEVTAPIAQENTTEEAITEEETTPATEAAASAVTEAPTEPETEPETVQELLPLSEVQVDGKGNESGFFTDYYSDHSIIIGGVITDGSYGLTTYDDVNGSHESVTIPESVNGYTVRCIAIISLAAGDWNGVNEVCVPAGMKFTTDYQTEITFEEAKPYFEKCGISLTVY